MTHPQTSRPLYENYDVVVIGAGPAGIAAATTAASGGARTLMLDENAGPGGQVWRSIMATPVKKPDILGSDYWSGKSHVDALRASGAEILHRATVWSLDASLELAISIGGGSCFVKAGQVIIATGAQERPFPIPGWTLPGVMTAGAAQTLIKNAGLVPDGKLVIAGQGPLLWLLSAQILRLGGKIERILVTTPKGNLSAALPKALPFLTSPYLAKGIKMLCEVKRQASIVNNVTAIKALGDGQLASVSYTANGKFETLAADVLLLHQGVVPNVNLAMAAGVKHEWDDAQLCWRPVLDENGQTNLPGIYIAGDGAGIGGAQAALERGRIAALGALKAQDISVSQHTMDETRKALIRAEKGRAFLDILYKPAEQFRIPDGDTIVCRCEEIRARDVLKAVETGASGPNQAKAYLRTGMGPCQGRLCGLTMTELMAKACKTTPQKIGYYRLRAPIKPIALNELADLPTDEIAYKAVVRE
ncbi:NAD(P)/FAD-dependent oxidoreductase [Brucella pseudogrignonensis]|uniref:FAD/NAD(P)-dependent oxidoreductase n=1 Tax=Brucella pseudogrignonensis TaxID=419475 RepID=UPI0028B782B3|nr:NAD(P)/FAD-dependent oxidoreductase [Brucella pseudogrignonensis]MDT6942337.1 NAD(P)/FAD-dependent oxidoreductase [Brucella pseudogrignonensis]